MHGPNLVKNSGFESGLPPWQTLVTLNAQGTAAPSNESAKIESFSLRIENRSPLMPDRFISLFQKISVESGSNYCLFVWTKTVSGTPGILSFTMDKAWSDRIGLPPGSKDWTLYTRTFVAESASVDLRMISENTGTVFVDDVQLRKGKCKVEGEVPVGKGI